MEFIIVCGKVEEKQNIMKELNQHNIGSGRKRLVRDGALNSRVATGTGGGLSGGEPGPVTSCLHSTRLKSKSLSSSWPSARTRPVFSRTEPERRISAEVPVPRRRFFPTGQSCSRRYFIQNKHMTVFFMPAESTTDRKLNRRRPKFNFIPCAASMVLHKQRKLKTFCFCFRMKCMSSLISSVSPFFLRCRSRVPGLQARACVLMARPGQQRPVSPSFPFPLHVNDRTRVYGNPRSFSCCTQHVGMRYSFLILSRN